MMEKEKWHWNYMEPEDFILEVYIQLNMTRVLEESDKQTLFLMLMEYALRGEMFEKKERPKNKIITKLYFYQISHVITHLHEENSLRTSLTNSKNILLSRIGIEKY